MLDGEIAYCKEEFDRASECLRTAVRLGDGQNYDESWGWMQRARHALGVLLLEPVRVTKAEDVYRMDLKQLPNNAWSLYGLSEALQRQGKKKKPMPWTGSIARSRHGPMFATGRASVDYSRNPQ